MMSTDPALQWLVQQASPKGDSLWLCDEHFYGFEQQLPATENHRYLCNRYDIAQRMRAAGCQVSFNDFDTETIPEASVETVFYRLSKEKPVVHHLMNTAARVLRPGGVLHIAGLKNEGAKTLLEKAAACLGTTKATRKNGLAYVTSLPKQSSDSVKLDDQNYHQLRPLNSDATYLSKPGVFGWQKVDAGSAFLLATLKAQPRPWITESLLDLGCGYGYLAFAAARELAEKAPSTLVLTDNNAAALLAAKANAERLGLSASVIASDAGREVQGEFDTILCNPPFHQGFALSEDLTERFLTSAARHLRKNGSAFFVVNAFIPAEEKARPLFKSVRTLANNRQFKVLQLSQTQ